MPVASPYTGSGGPGVTSAATPDSLASVPPPQNAVDWSYAILLSLGIAPTTNNVNALLAQMHVEDNTLSYLSAPTRNNPLAVTNSNYASATPLPGNSAGVQTYSNWVDGLAATVADIKANPAMLSALQSNSTCAQYGNALTKSSWEGSSASANASYGASVAGSCGYITNQYNGAASPAFGQWLANNVGGNILQQAGEIISGSAGAAASAAGATVSWTASLGKLLGDLDSVTWWERVGTFVLGLAAFLVGLVVFISTTKTGQRVESDAPMAAMAAA